MKKLTKITAIILSMILFTVSVIPSYAYTVKEGDTLGRISVICGVPISKLRELNNITDPNKIYVGQELITEGGDYIKYDRTHISNSSKKVLKGLFDADWYRESYPDVVKVVGDSDEALFGHYLQYGLWETRQPNADFNVNAYYMAYSDLQNAYENLSNSEKILNLSLHYANYGQKENREVTTIQEYCDMMVSQGVHSIHITDLSSYHNPNAPTERNSDIVVETAPSSADTGTGTSNSGSPSSGCVHNVVVDSAAVAPSLGGFGYTAQSHCSICGDIISQRRELSNEDLIVNLSDRLAHTLAAEYIRDDYNPSTSTTFSNTEMWFIGTLVVSHASLWGVDTSEVSSDYDSSTYIYTQRISRAAFEEATEKMFGKSFFSTYGGGDVIGQTGRSVQYDSASDQILVCSGAHGGAGLISFTDLTINGNQYVYEISVKEYDTQAVRETWTLTATLTSDGCLRLNSLAKN